MWLIAKEQFLSKSKELFRHRCYNHITMLAHLRTPLSSEEFVKEFVTKNVLERSEQLLELSNIATTVPHATFTGFGHGYVHNPSKKSWQNFYKILARILQESCNNLARILSRIQQDCWQECLITMQDPCKILTGFLQDSCKILQEISKILARSLKNSCKCYTKTLQNFSRYLENFATIIQDSCHNYPRCLQNPSKLQAKFCKNYVRFL